MNKRFAFEFVPEDDNAEIIVHFFTLDGPPELFNSADYDDHHLPFLMDIESDYGVHDFVTTGDEEFIGFTSYEVKPDKHDELIAKWRGHFESKGYTLGPTEKATSDAYQKRFFS